MDLPTTLRVFVRVAELGGFTAAARDLGLAQPTVSKAVAELEGRLGVRLLNRSTQSLSLTEEGRSALDQARSLVADLAAFEDGFGRRRAEPTGRVRIACPVAFGRLQVVPRLPALLARHPALEIDLAMSDAAIDLVEGGIDLAIRVGEVTDQTLISRRLGLTRRVTVAARAYLAARGRPEEPRDLARHDCIVYTYLATGGTWVFDGPKGRAQVAVTGRFRANNSEAVREGVLAGLGIAVTPTWLFRDELASGEVEVLFPDHPPVGLPIHALWPSRRFTAPKVRAVVEHLAAEFRLDPALSDYGHP